MYILGEERYSGNLSIQLVSEKEQQTYTGILQRVALLYTSLC